MASSISGRRRLPRLEKTTPRTTCALVRSRAVAVCLLVLLFPSCCSVPVLPADPISTDAGECIERYGDELAVVAPTVDFSGTWAQAAVRTSVNSPPIIGEVTTTVTGIARIEIVQDGQDLTLEFEICDVQTVSDNDSARTELPEAFVSSFPVFRRSATVVGVNGGHMFFSEDHVQVRGANLADERTDLLPSDEDDSRISDPDGDGHPGLTIRVFGFVEGEMYIVQRIHTALCGFTADPNQIDGALEWQLEQVTLDASSFMLDRQTDVHPHPDPDRHFFRTTRVEPATTCQEIVDGADHLFAR